MYTIGMFAHVTYTLELISKFVQLEIVHSIRLVGVP